MVGFLLGVLAFLLLAIAVVVTALLYVFRKPLFSKEHDALRRAVPVLTAQMVGELLLEATEQNLPEPTGAALMAAMSSFAIAVDRVESELPTVTPTVVNFLNHHSREAPNYRKVQEEYVNLMRRVTGTPQYVRAVA